MIYNLNPPAEDPTLDHVLHVSPKVAQWLDGGLINPLEARLFESMVWSEHLAVANT